MQSSFENTSLSSDDSVGLASYSPFSTFSREIFWSRLFSSGSLHFRKPCPILSSSTLFCPVSSQRCHPFPAPTSGSFSVSLQSFVFSDNLGVGSFVDDTFSSSCITSDDKRRFTDSDFRNSLFENSILSNFPYTNVSPLVFSFLSPLFDSTMDSTDFSKYFSHIESYSFTSFHTLSLDLLPSLVCTSSTSVSLLLDPESITASSSVWRNSGDQHDNSLSPLANLSDIARLRRSCQTFTPPSNLSILPCILSNHSIQVYHHRRTTNQVTSLKSLRTTGPTYLCAPSGVVVKDCRSENSCRSVHSYSTSPVSYSAPYYYVYDTNSSTTENIPSLKTFVVSECCLQLDCVCPLVHSLLWEDSHLDNKPIFMVSDKHRKSENSFRVKLTQSQQCPSVLSPIPETGTVELRNEYTMLGSMEEGKCSNTIHAADLKDALLVISNSTDDSCELIDSLRYDWPLYGGVSSVHTTISDILFTPSLTSYTFRLKRLASSEWSVNSTEQLLRTFLTGACSDPESADEHNSDISLPVFRLSSITKQSLVSDLSLTTYIHPGRTSVPPSSSTYLSRCHIIEESNVPSLYSTTGKNSVKTLFSINDRPSSSDSITSNLTFGSRPHTHTQRKQSYYEEVIPQVKTNRISGDKRTPIFDAKNSPIARDYDIHTNRMLVSCLPAQEYQSIDPVKHCRCVTPKRTVNNRLIYHCKTKPQPCLCHKPRYCVAPVERLPSETKCCSLPPNSQKSRDTCRMQPVKQDRYTSVVYQAPCLGGRLIIDTIPRAYNALDLRSSECHCPRPAQTFVDSRYMDLIKPRSINHVFGGCKNMILEPSEASCKDCAHQK
ncbi:hypothetical protein EG68_11157 [Paragonimus skrjabini miyazakii]|uniref:Uncharacterized protein n=1 Tax=Paragonimus skrjabini miyazakii TaxID=59628 RepID=A0A8S9YL60_9TREM|nr:hypothetical protein EG68_11157 [Paragonimus skrjabini miyazakii]